MALALPTLAAMHAPPALAGDAAASGAASAQILAPLVVTRLADLDFGIVTADGARVVTVPPSEGPSSAGRHPAHFVLRGEPGRAYVVALPVGVVATGRFIAAVPGMAVPPPLLVSAMTIRTASRPQAGPRGVLNADGVDSFTIGGTLTLPVGLPAARYHAELPVIVIYN